jgi:membrane associated rhomboid family serine protease/Tfp pilus assembly protein PilF
MLKSPVTLAICILCILVFILEIALGGNVNNCSGEILLNLGASTGPLTIGQAQYGRLISCIFLHAYLLHIALNLYVLIDFGPMAENSLGRKFYCFIFLFSGIIGALTSILYNPTQTSVGASAAVLGLLGALIYKTWFEKHGARFSRPQLVMLCVFLLYSFLLGITSDVIDNAAHLGGFFAGMIACAAFFGTRAQKPVTSKRAFTATALLLVLIPALIFIDTKRVIGNPDVTIFQLRMQAAECVKKKHFAQALDKLNYAQDISSNKDTALLFDRAGVLEKLDQYDPALKDVNLWLEHEKGDVLALVLKAGILHDLKKDEQAIETINQALRQKPITIMDYFNGAVKGNAGQGMLYNNRAWFKLSLGQVKEALADCDKSLSIDRRLATAYDTRGVAYLMLKDFGQAQKDFSRSLELNAAFVKGKPDATEDGAGYYHRAIARLALGDKAGAKEDMDRFKSLDYRPEAWEPKP